MRIHTHTHRERLGLHICLKTSITRSIHTRRQNESFERVYESQTILYSRSILHLRFLAQSILYKSNEMKKKKMRQKQAKQQQKYSQLHLLERLFFFLLPQYATTHMCSRISFTQSYEAEFIQIQ